MLQLIYVCLYVCVKELEIAAMGVFTRLSNRTLLNSFSNSTLCTSGYVCIITAYTRLLVCNARIPRQRSIAGTAWLAWVPGTSVAWAAEMAWPGMRALQRQKSGDKPALVVSCLHALCFYPPRRGISPDPAALGLFCICCHLGASCVQLHGFAPLVVTLLIQLVWLWHHNTTKHLYPIFGYAWAQGELIILTYRCHRPPLWLYNIKVIFARKGRHIEWDNQNFLCTFSGNLNIKIDTRDDW